MKTSCFLFILIVTSAVMAVPVSKKFKLDRILRDPAVGLFREYLQIDTSKEENLEYAVDFWRRQAADVGLQFAVHAPAGRPICVLSWPGAQPELPAIMLNSHMDVVPIEPEDWNYPPFGAEVNEDGDIFARGAQDCKDVSIQYLEAIRQLKAANVTQLKRTVHITLMPDEETGGFYGMIPFSNTTEFADLNIGFALDEGLSSTDDTLLFTYVDKRPWQLKFTVHGASGHGSTLPVDTAAEKFRRLLATIGDYRDSQLRMMQQGDSSYNNLNINVVNGGLATNIIPNHMSLTVDMRLSVTANVTDMENVVESWLEAAGNGTDMVYLRRIDHAAGTPVDDSSVYWRTIQRTVEGMGMTARPLVCPATSDMIYLRNLGIPALGFSPKTHTESRLHGANEYINVVTFLRGIDIYAQLIKALGNTI